MTNVRVNANDLSQLQDMGFPANRAEKALMVTGNQGAQVAMDWIFAHMDDPDIDEPYKAPEGHVLGGSAGANVAEEAATRPDLVLNPDTAEKELAKPLTAEEKAEQLAKVQQRLQEKKKERLEQEKRDMIEQEKKRRQMGKEVSSAKHQHEQQQARKLAEEMKRQKEEDRLARERVKQQIALDKANRAAKFAKTSSSASPVSSNPPTMDTTSAPSSTAGNTVTGEKKEYATARLKICLPDGKSVMETFPASDTVGIVLDFASAKMNGEPVKLMTTFPRKVYTSAEGSISLAEAGWAPSTVLMVQR
eukprot:Nk52_evm10s158 gene=Nk52_evmTU10s158